MLNNTKICPILNFDSNNTNNVAVSWKGFTYSSQGPSCPFLVLITKHHGIRINYSSQGPSCPFLVLITKHKEIRILKFFLSAFHFSLLFCAGRFYRIHLTQNILVTVWTIFYFCFNVMSTAKLLIISKSFDYLHTRKWFSVNASELSKTTLTLVNERLLTIDSTSAKNEYMQSSVNCLSLTMLFKGFFVILPIDAVPTDIQGLLSGFNIHFDFFLTLFESCRYLTSLKHL